MVARLKQFLLIGLKNLMPCSLSVKSPHPLLTRSQFHLLFSEGGWVLLGQALAAAGGLVLVWLLSHSLSPESYGVLSLALTLAALVNQSLTGAVAAAAGRFYSVCAPSGEWSTYLACLIKLFAGALAGVALFAFFFYWLFSWLGKLPTIFVLCALLLSVVTGYNATIGGIQTAARRRATTALFSTLEAWAKVICCFLIVWLAAPSTYSVLLSLLVAAFVAAAMQTGWLLRVNGCAPQLGVIKSANGRKHLLVMMLYYSWPFNVWGFFSWIQQSSDRWALEMFGSTSEVGIYAVLLQVAYLPMTMMGNIACLLAGPVLFGRASSPPEPEKARGVRHITWLVSFALVGVSVLAALVAGLLRQEISGLLTGPAFRNEVALWLAPVFLAGGVFAAGQFLSLRLMAEMQSQRILVVKLATSLLGLGMNLAGAFIYGLAGVVFAAVFFSILHYAWMAVACISTKQNASNLKSDYETYSC